MPTALITSLIPQQNFESVRNAIGAILALELANQYALYNAADPQPAFPYPNINKVWVERIIAFDGPTELPAINVNIDFAEWMNQSIAKRDGCVTFNIDIETYSGASISGLPGNQFAGYMMQKIAGLVTAILSNPVYIGPPLGFAPGFIGYVQVKKLMVPERGVTYQEDNLSIVRGRVQVEVKIMEQNFGNSANPVPLSSVMSKILMEDTAYGFLIKLATT